MINLDGEIWVWNQEPNTIFLRLHEPFYFEGLREEDLQEAFGYRNSLLNPDITVSIDGEFVEPTAITFGNWGLPNDALIIFFEDVASIENIHSTVIPCFVL